MSATIIVLSRFPDIFEPCRTSADLLAPYSDKVLVRDGHDIIDPSGWTTIQGPEGPFIYSRNVNLGINQTKDSVLLVNDDVRFVSPCTIEAMEKVLITHPDIGILSPKIDGGVGNADQSGVTESVRYTRQRIAFVCVLIRRAVIAQIGLLDENFSGYGEEDTDFCRRAVVAGWKMACTADAIVKHGHGKEKWSSSYQRVHAGKAQTQKAEQSAQIYFAKWGDNKHQDFLGRPVITNVPYTNNGLVQDWWAKHPR
jgi:hypothetical protein